jgi:hydroxymethylpyrimidine kinase/phosphomethylpyrimidine kinase
MRKQPRLPIALTIAGSDSGGGAGIQADLNTFAALGVHGTTAITCVTAQNYRHVCAIEPCPPTLVRQQIEALFEALPPDAVKTGMLYSTPIIRVVIEFFRQRPRVPLVVDPVMISTSGTRLLQPSAFKLLQAGLLPLATLVTPNLDEATALTGVSIRSVEDSRHAARLIHGQFGCAVLVKGGHFKGQREAADIFYDGKNELLLSAPFVKGVRTHGTGCAYSAAITAYLASNLPLPTAVAKAKEHITQAILGSQFAAGNPILNHFWRKARD